MKKLITAIGIIITITTSTLLCTLVVKEMKQSVKEYFNNDVVGGDLVDENIYYITKQDLLPENIIKNNKRNSSSMVQKDENVTTDKNEIINSISDIEKDTNNDFINNYIQNNVKANKNLEALNTDSIKDNKEVIGIDSINTISSKTKNEETDSNLNAEISEIENSSNTVNEIENSSNTVNEYELSSGTDNKNDLSSDPINEIELDNNTINRKADTVQTQNNSTKINLSDKSSILSNTNHYSFDVEDTVEPSSNVSASVQTALNIINPSIQINATSAILIDSKTGKVIYHKNATSPIYPASTTKLMTALVALEYCKLSEEVTIGNEIYFMASDSSRAYLSVGQRLTMEMLIEGMLIPSGNDAAYAVAAYVGRVSLGKQNVDEKTAVSEFIKLMNKKTTTLGLKNTHFKNPDGYDTNGQYTTAYDMGMIAMEALKNTAIRNITSKTHTRNVFLSGEDVTWYSSNKLIDPGSGMYYKYAIGLKTGSSSLAGRCLVSAAENNTKSYISVIMNSTVTGRWEDSISLLKFGLEYEN